MIQRYKHLNNYEILEVDKNASNEVIDKAYKTLAKKYHPDLQKGTNKEIYQNKMKQINEAFEVLSNNDKRKEYDSRLAQNNISIEQYNKVLQENMRLKSSLNKIADDQNKNELESIEFARKYYNELKKKSQEPVRYTYKRRINITKEKLKKMVYGVIYIICLITILAVIPFTRNFFINLYNENIVVKTIVNIFKNTFVNSFLNG